jgi:copper chaperone NosL
MFMRVLPSLVLLLLLGACSGPDATGPGEVRWDRETCTRCSMAISDHLYAAQVRGASSGEKSRLYKFDDIGCALIWLEQQPWKDDARTEIWVADYRNGNWLDAHSAFYLQDRISPMNYGLGAQPENTGDALDFAEAKAHIFAVEKERGGHQHHHEMKP